VGGDATFLPGGKNAGRRHHGEQEHRHQRGRKRHGHELTLAGREASSKPATEHSDTEEDGASCTLLLLIALDDPFQTLRHRIVYLWP